MMAGFAAIEASNQYMQMASVCKMTLAVVAPSSATLFHTVVCVAKMRAIVAAARFADRQAIAVCI